MTTNSFGARDRLTVDDAVYDVFRLDQVEGSARLPYSLKVLLENLLRNEDGWLVTTEQISALAEWGPSAGHGRGDPVHSGAPDFTGAPCVVDLVAMRYAMAAFGADPPVSPVLVPARALHGGRMKTY